MLAVASSILTLAPKDSSGAEAEDLETYLQYLTNVENTNGFETMSGGDFVSSVLSKQHKYADIQHMVASQNKGVLVTDMSNTQIMEAFKAATISHFSSGLWIGQIPIARVQLEFASNYVHLRRLGTTPVGRSL
jgi:hypothetical protein